MASVDLSSVEDVHQVPISDRRRRRQLVRDAFGHLKVVGHVPEARPLLAKLGDVEADEGVLEVGGAKAFGPFITPAKKHRVWDREPSLRSPG
jgi:catalase